MWKSNDQAVARYDNGEVMFYHGSPFQQDRANITADFDGKWFLFDVPCTTLPCVLENLKKIV